MVVECDAFWLLRKRYILGCVIFNSIIGGEWHKVEYCVLPFYGPVAWLITNGFPFYTVLLVSSIYSILLGTIQFSGHISFDLSLSFPFLLYPHMRPHNRWLGISICKQKKMLQDNYLLKENKKKIIVTRV